MLTPINSFPDRDRHKPNFQRGLRKSRVHIYDRLAPEVKLHLALVLFSSNITVVVQRLLKKELKK